MLNNNQIQQNKPNPQKYTNNINQITNQNINNKHNQINNINQQHKSNKKQNIQQIQTVSYHKQINNNINQQFILKSNQQVRQQVKKWEKQRKSIQNKRNEQIQTIKNKLNQQDLKISQQKTNQQNIAKQLKKIKIQQNLQQIQKRKQSRSQFLSQSKSTKIKQPLFIQKQKQFLQKKIQQQQTLRTIIHNKKQQMLKQMQQLTNHQINFLNHIKQRKNHKTKSTGYDNSSNFNTQNNIIRTKSDFNLHLKKGQNFQQQSQKLNRRKQFQKKIKKHAISIDSHKAKQALIAKDKALNPLKYHYLSSASALTNERIYDEFKNFQLKTDRKKIGNQYLRQILTNKPKASRIRSISQSQITKNIKPQYKNYIPQVKSKLKKQINKQPNNQIQQIIFKFNNNSDRLTNLNKKSNYYQNQAVKKIKQMKSNQNTPYSEHLHQEKIIDDLYMKSIKIKIATAQFIN